MRFKKTVSSFIAGLVLLAPVSARAVSHSNFVEGGSTHGTFNSAKWQMGVNQKDLPLASIHYGTASWYGPGFYGNQTACGQIYRPGTFTIAHRTLPCGTQVRITNLNNGRTTVATVNDRGPYVGGRIVDLGHGTASYLRVTTSGLADVKLEILN